MIAINTNWTEIKNFISSRGLSVQWLLINDTYYLAALDGAYGITCQLLAQIGVATEDRLADVIDFENNFKSNGNKTLPQQSSPFAAKTLSNGKKLYKREHGIQVDLVVGDNTILFPIPYNWVKITGLEVMWGEKLDNIDLFVLDSTAGSYSGLANRVLNQFGYAVNVAKDKYEEQNAYDADLYIGMQIKVVYRSATAKTVGINFSLNEVK